MVANADNQLTINFGSQNGERSFATVEELRGFCGEQRAFLSRFQKQDGTRYSQLVSQPVPEPLNAFQNMEQLTHKHRLDEFLGHPSISQLEKIYRTRNWPLSDSVVGAFIEKLAEKNLACAAGAIGTYIGTSEQAPLTMDQHLGRHMLLSFLNDSDDMIATTLKKILDRQSANTTKRLSSTLKDFDVDSKDVLETAAKTVRQSRDTALASVRRHADAWRKMDKVFKGTIDEAREQLAAAEETRKTFEELMRLKAPADYWNAEAANHRKGRNTLIRLIVAAFIIVSGSLGMLGYQYGADIMSYAENAKSPGTYLILGSSLLATTTIVFWLFRILVRLFLSAHHLMLDAKDREVLIRTFLALTHGDAATAEDRALVLGAIFRPTADGIVKDEAAPDFNLAALLSKVAASRN